MVRWFAVVALCVLTATAAAFFDGSSKVINLTPENFESEVLQSDHLWIVEFYAPWCGHCKNLAPEWSKAARALFPMIRLGAVNADAHSELGSKFGVAGYPTIKVFGNDKTTPEEYDGGRTAETIIEAAIAEAKKMALARVDVPVGRMKESNKEKPNVGGDKKKIVDEPNKDGVGFFDSSDVVVLTDENWDGEVGKAKEGFLVKFYAPWCGHCKNLAPEWKKAATGLLGDIKLASVDVTTNKKLGERFKVNSFPTLKFFSPGAEVPEDYTGGRSASDIIAYGQQKAELHPMAPASISQIADNAAFEALCEGRPLCVVFIVPHVFDTGAVGRDKYIEMFTTVAGTLRARRSAFGWIVGGEHITFEQGFGIFESYPTFVAVNVRSGRFYTHRGMFTAEKVSAALKNVLDGKVGTKQVTVLPKMSNGVNLWDGKDYIAGTDED